MTKAEPTAPQPVLFSRPVPAEKLRQGCTTFKQHCIAEPAEREAVMAAFGLPSLETLIFEARIQPYGAEAWQLEGTLQATGAQSCRVTLEPVPFAIETPVTRLWSENRVASSDEIEYHFSTEEEDEDEMEPLPHPVDLGAVALEALSLALEPYPRAENISFEAVLAGPPGVEPLTDAAVHPFAALQALKKSDEDA